MAKTCPKCRLTNPDVALRCDCGYDFAEGSMKESFLTSEQAPAQASIRSVARVLALGAALFYTLFALVASQAAPSGGAVAIVFIFVGLGALGAVIGWRWEGVGGAMMMAGGMGLWFAVPALDPNAGVFSAFSWAVPFFVAGTLFVICWYRTRGQEA